MKNLKLVNIQVKTLKHNFFFLKKKLRNIWMNWVFTWQYIVFFFFYFVIVRKNDKFANWNPLQIGIFTRFLIN